MPRKFSVDIETGAFATITVELNDDRLQEIATDLEKSVHELTIADLRIYIEESNWEKPWICAQCSGWGKKYSMELGDEWDVNEDKSAIREEI